MNTDGFDFCMGWDNAKGPDFTCYTAGYTLWDGKQVTFSHHVEEPGIAHPRIRCEIDCIGYERGWARDQK